MVKILVWKLRYGITSYQPKIQTPLIKISSIETPNGFYNSLKNLRKKSKIHLRY